ncbi:hypothetical protein Trydic_g6995 [Trypoxylus dichotomus]
MKMRFKLQSETDARVICGSSANKSRENRVSVRDARKGVGATALATAICACRFTVGSSSPAISDIASYTCTSNGSARP